MRNYYVFLNHGTGWLQADTIWLSKSDAIDALMFATRDSDVKGLIGYDDDKGMLRIPDSIDDVLDDSVCEHGYSKDTRCVACDPDGR
jgi:hypothetical protein